MQSRELQLRVGAHSKGAVMAPLRAPARQLARGAVAGPVPGALLAPAQLSSFTTSISWRLTAERQMLRGVSRPGLKVSAASRRCDHGGVGCICGHPSAPHALADCFSV